MLFDDLVRSIFDDPTTALARDCVSWMSASRRFSAFMETYHDKVRKKVRVCRDEHERRNLRAELATAFWLLQDPRLTVEYEAYAAGKQRAPDFRVMFKMHTPFNVEVTRLQITDPTPQSQAANSAKLLSVVCDKLTQMPPSIVNILILVTDQPAYTAADVASTMRRLKSQAEQKDEAFFQRRGFAAAREFLKHYAQLSAIILRSTASGATEATGGFWLNPEARHPLLPALGFVIADL